MNDIVLKNPTSEEIGILVSKVDSILSAIQRLPQTPDEPMGDLELMIDDVEPILLSAGRKLCSDALEMLGQLDPPQTSDTNGEG